jgi:hypothetical protein
MIPSNKEFIYAAWAPAESPWSPWVKPVLFASMEGAPQPAPMTRATPDLSWLPAAPAGTALVLDLPREEGAELGLELARSGYRPVPLYNAVPATLAYYLAAENPLAPGVDSVVDVLPIMHALWRGAEPLAAAGLRPDAPPAFLLDANRRVGRMMPAIGSFDNRSVSFTTDFPSAIFLRSHGINRAILVQRFQDRPQPDLAHTLRNWQAGGIRIGLKRLELAGAAAVCDPGRSSFFGALWHRLWAAFNLRRNELGGYGGTISPPSGG